METKKLIVRLPKESFEFARQYAAAHRMTLTELIDRYLRSLRERSDPISDEVKSVSALIPPDLNAQAEYQEHMEAR